MEEARNATERPTTEVWARAFGIPTATTLPAIQGYAEPCQLGGREVAARAIILQGVVAAAFEVAPEPIIQWYASQGIWESVSPKERSFLLNPTAATREETMRLRWYKEAEWALLWTIGRVDYLGLPTHQCGTQRLVDEIIPELDSDIGPFLASASLRSPGELLAEDDRHYDLWCRYLQTRRERPHLLPSDLNPNVLYQRRYAFEWLSGVEAWDDVQCDA